MSAASESVYRLRARRLAAGQCRDCGALRESLAPQCDLCRAHQTLRARQRRERLSVLRLGVARPSPLAPSEPPTRTFACASCGEPSGVEWRDRRDRTVCFACHAADGAVDEREVTL